MDHEVRETLISIQNALEKLLSGKQCHQSDLWVSAPELERISSQVGQLIQNINEMNELALDLSQGKLDGDIPPRQNYMAGPLKQLHSQLCVLTQSCRQLQSGYIVSKLEHTGELFNVFNGLIDQIASGLSVPANTRPETEEPANSWRYHQILQALNLLHICVLESDYNGHVIYANRPAKELFGDIRHISEGDHASLLLQLLTETINQDAFPLFREIYDECDCAWYRITSNKFSLPNEQTFCLHVIENISDWKISEQQLKLSASIDSMTGTHNRRAGLERLEALLNCKDSPKTHVLVFVDVDDLKSINDTYGHSEGDYAIRTISKILLSSVRSPDLVCRYGGDEFFIIFQDCTEEISKKILCRMQDNLKEMERKVPKPYPLSFSYGTVTFSVRPNFSVKAEDLLKKADQRMYYNKSKKKQALKKLTCDVN